MDVLCGIGIKKVACGTQFSVALTKDGNVYTFGQGASTCSLQSCFIYLSKKRNMSKVLSFSLNTLPYFWDSICFQSQCRRSSDRPARGTCTQSQPPAAGSHPGGRRRQRCRCGGGAYTRPGVDGRCLCLGE